MKGPIQRTIRHWIPLWLIILGLCQENVGGATTTLSERRFTADQVREFLDHPPRYASLLLQRTLAVRPISFRSEREATRFLRQWNAGTVSVPAETSWFELRYQTEPPAFFLRALTDTDQYGQTWGRRQAPLAGRYGSDWWSVLDVVPGQVQLLRSLDGLDITSAGVTNAYHQGNERWATEFLRLGMFEVRLETLRWQAGNQRFEATLESGVPCLGRVDMGAEWGSAVLWLEFPGLNQGKRIQVFGRESADRWLPERLVVDQWTGSIAAPALSPYATFEVLEQTLSNDPIPREQFSPEPYLRTNDLWVEIEKGHYFSLELVGTNLVRTLAPPLPQFWGLQQWLRTLLLIAVVGVGGWLLLHYVLEWRRRCRA